MPEKIYIGDARKIDFAGGGSKISATLKLDGFKKYFEEYGFTSKQGKKCLKINICEKREPDQFENTHYVEIDTYRPSKQGD